MKFIISFLFFIFNFLFINISYANDKHSFVEFVHDKNHIILNIHLEDGWKAYSNIVGEVGVPSYIKIKNSKNLEKYHITWPDPIYENSSNSYVYHSNYSPFLTIFPIDKTLPIILDLEIFYAICKDICIPIKLSKNLVIKIDEVDDRAIPFNKKEVPKFIIIIFIAFLGGVILNFMPCILPVISLKAIYILKHVDFDKKNIRRNFLYVSLGIIASFTSVGLFIMIAKSLGYLLGIGFHFQQPLFLISIILMLLLFAINLNDGFHISLPQYINDYISSKTNHSNFCSNFLSGVFVTILATPCSAPFVGTAMGFALSTNIIEAVVIFIFLGIGLSFPYLLLAIYPSLLNRILPKPGIWMQKLKFILSLLLYMTIIWFIYILSNQLGFKAALILFLLTILIKFVVEHSIARKNILILILVILCFWLPMNLFNEKIYIQSLNDKVWHEFKPEMIDSLVNEGKIVFVDITADWCGSCQINKLLTTNTVKTLNFLNNTNIISMQSNISSSTTKETYEYMNKMKRHGIPLNVIYGPNARNGVILPTFFTLDQLKRTMKRAGELSP